MNNIITTKKWIHTRTSLENVNWPHKIYQINRLHVSFPAHTELWFIRPPLLQRKKVSLFLLPKQSNVFSLSTSITLKPPSSSIVWIVPYIYPNLTSFRSPFVFMALLLLLLSLLPLVFSDEASNSYAFPRPLIIEYSPLRSETSILGEEIQLRCTSWRFASEANNLNPWKTIPEECAHYVRDYITGKGYSIDLERVNMEAGNFAESVELNSDGKDVWIFDVDETLLSNLPYYAEHLYG